jgi:hypothetical protein
MIATERSWLREAEPERGRPIKPETKTKADSARRKPGNRPERVNQPTISLQGLKKLKVQL